MCSEFKIDAKNVLKYAVENVPKIFFNNVRHLSHYCYKNVLTTSSVRGRGRGRDIVLED